MKNETLLKVEGLYKRYGAQPVIRNFSLELHAGERLAISAPCGAGKTTLLRILCGLENPDSGCVQVFAPPVMLFQEPRLFPFLTVEENILLPLRTQRRALTAAIRRSYRRWLAVCALEDSTALYPWQLSGGMQQKTALVRALLGDPRLLLMDEPFHSLDAAARAGIIAHMDAYHPQAALLLITHAPEEAAALGARLMRFDQVGIWDAELLPPSACFENPGAASAPSALFPISY